VPHLDSSDRFSDSVRLHGVLGTVRRGVRALFRPVLDDTRVIRFRERLFDRRFGVVTAGILPRERLSLSGPSAEHAIHYEAAQPILVEQALAGLQIDHRSYTFIDFGCGKGKALLLASSFPFERIVGIELSSELAQTAAANVAKYRSRKQRCRAIEARCADALDFEFPRRPLVCFLYNPFGEVVLSRVLDNLAQSLTEHPRDVIVVYVHPELDRLFHARDFLSSVRSRPWCSIYRSRPEASAPGATAGGKWTTTFGAA
jgi:SAM-dependent methyltransferase